MPKATWNGQVIAESEAFEELEGNVYFPPDSIKKEFYQPSEHTTVCGWKGLASYFHVVVDGKENRNAAWCYADPRPKAEKIRGHIGFWKGVEVER